MTNRPYRARHKQFSPVGDKRPDQRAFGREQAEKIRLTRLSNILSPEEKALRIGRIVRKTVRCDRMIRRIGRSNLSDRMQSGDPSVVVGRDLQRKGDLLSAWVDREVEASRKAFEALSPEEQELAAARAFLMMSPVRGIIEGGKK